MSKKSCFRGRFDKWHGKRAKTLLKSWGKHLYHIYWSLWRQFRLKKSLLMICKILGLFFNPLTSDHKYSLLNRGNLLQHFQRQLSKKRKIFSEFFFFFTIFWTYIQIWPFSKKDDPHSGCIFELTDSEKRG